MPNIPLDGATLTQCPASLFSMLSAVLALALSQIPTTTELSASARDPLAVLLIAPTGVEGKVLTTDLLASVSQLVDERTDFRVERIAPQRAAGCQGRLSCLVDKVRDDWDSTRRTLGNGTNRPYAEHLADLARRETPYPRYLLVISNLTGGDQDLLEVTLIDTDAALEVRHSLDDATDKDPAQRESLVAKAAVVAGPSEKSVGQTQEADRFLLNFFTSQARRKLTDAGHWEPYGTVTITAPEGLAIKLDSRTIGTTGAGVTRLTQVHAGRRTLYLSSPAYEDYETRFELKRNSSVQLQPTLTEAASPLTSGVRTALMFAGLGAAAAGIGVTAYSLTQPSGDVTVYCPTINPCGGTFTSFGYSPGDAPAVGNLNGGGVKTAPLGMALIGTGAAWSLGTLFYGEDADWPWLQVVGGLVVGGLTYGLGHGLSD